MICAVVLLGTGCGGGEDDGGGGGGVPAPGATGDGEGHCAADQRFDPGEDHVPNPSYTVDPPAGGEHLPAAAPPGAYRDAPPDGSVVHAMEHGYVVLWYRPDVDEEVQKIIVSLGEEFRRELLIVPRASLKVPVAMTAWRQRLLCEGPDEDQLAEFVRTHLDKGPETGFL